MKAPAVARELLPGQVEVVEATPAELLRDAAALLADWPHWCQGAWARSRMGESIPPTDGRAWAWDPGGAVVCVGRDARPEVVARARGYLRAVAAAQLAILPPNDAVSAWNDQAERRHADLAPLFAAAVRRAERDEAAAAAAAERNQP